MGLGTEIRKGFSEDLEQEAARKIIRAIEKWKKGGKVQTAQRRWLFELIQNALDVFRQQPTANLKIEIITDDNRVLFRHNAGYFAPREIRALILAYSTKPYDRESELTGKFATGFLVTHIVSEKVGVKGTINQDGIFYEFNILVDRESNNLSVISDNFSKSFEQLDSAVKIEEAPKEYWTEYIYESRNAREKESIDSGISEVSKCLPFLFTFNDITRIRINDRDYECKPEETINDKVSILRTDATDIWVANSGVTSVALALDTETNIVRDLCDAPRIYVQGLPLVETGYYVGTPFVLNSSKIETTEDRDSLTDTDTNREILQQAFNLYYGLTEEIGKYSQKQISNLHHLLDFERIPDERVLQNRLLVDLNNMIEKTATKIVREIPLVEVMAGERRQMSSVIFPAKRVKSAELQSATFEQFYKLLSEIKENIPSHIELDSWIDLAAKLKHEFGDTVDISLYGVDDLRDELVEFVKKRDSYPKFEDFSQEYHLSDSRGFLLSFLGLVEELYKCRIIESSDFVNYILPDQTGAVGPLKWEGGTLCLDEGIPEDFKNIASKIGWEIREALVDLDFAHFTIVKDLVRDKTDVTKAIETIIKDYPLEDEGKENLEQDDKAVGWIELFRWCVINGKVRKGLTIITKDGKSKQIEDLDDEAFIIPFTVMDIDEEFEGIYPESRIMHRKYFEMDNGQELARRLEHNVFVRSLPLYKESLTFAYNKLESVLSRRYNVPKVEHRIEHHGGHISTLPFWSDVIGRISDYEDRAKLLFRFVGEYLINVDESWQQSVRVSCSCGDKEHDIVPSHWLASLKADAWLPCKIMEDDEEKIVKREASKEGLEILFQQQELEHLLARTPESVTNLLLHFGFDGLDLKVKLQSIKLGQPEATVRKEVSKLVDISSAVPDLVDIASRDIDAFRDAVERFKETLDRRPLREENKAIGESVEKILRKYVSDRGYNVVPVHRGGDFEMWTEDGEGWDSGVIEIEPYLVEVKFTSTSRVHLSNAQSLTARERKANYLVLVVENVGNLRERLKAQCDETTVSGNLMNDVMGNTHVLEGIHTKLGSVPNPEEVEPDISGYWVKRKLWGDKSDLAAWFEMKFSGR